MRPRAFHLMRALGTCALATLMMPVLTNARTSVFTQRTFSFAILAHQYYGLYQEKSKEQDKGAKVSKDEFQAAKKIETAPDAGTRLQLAGEFIKKYPNSTLRSQVMGLVGSKIDAIQDPAQKITLLENFLKVFDAPDEANNINPILLDAYIKANRFEDAFRVASTYVEKNPDAVSVMAQMTMVGAEQVKRNDQSVLQPTQQFGAKAIELIEADKKPANMDAAQWNDYKTRLLPQLYQAMSIVSLVTGDAAGAKAKLEKAATLNPSDPFTFALIGNNINNEYQQTAMQYNSTAPGPAKDELLKKAQAQMDQVIDAFAHAVALSEGNAQHQQLHDQVMQALQDTYKQRYNGKLDGLQQLIDKYKKPSTPK